MQMQFVVVMVLMHVEVLTLFHEFVLRFVVLHRVVSADIHDEFTFFFRLSVEFLHDFKFLVLWFWLIVKV